MNQSDLVTESNDEILMKKESISSISKPYFCCFHNHGKVGDKGYFFQKVRCFFQIFKTNIPNWYPEFEF